jgi:hypothetical protein
MSALTTHTFGNQRKGKRKEMNRKETPTSDQKPRKARATARDIREKLCSSKEHKPPKHT